jgi:hypothetical protein
MGSRTDPLSLVQAEFPGHDRLIERAYRDNERFRTLCRDYRACVAALHRFKQLAAEEAPPRWQEYAELQVELGDEIKVWLEAMDKDSSHLGGGAQ